MLSIKDLEQEFDDHNLLIFMDLATITHSPSILYRLLNSVKQNKFDHSDRIVFYTSHIVPQPLLGFIHRCLQDLDIGSYFFELCSPAEYELKYPDPIQQRRRQLASTDELGQGYHTYDSMCYIPWMHLEIRHDSSVRPCCVSTDVAGKGDDLVNIMNNQFMNDLRQSFLRGEHPTGCDHCWHLEAAGIPSNRGWFNKRYRTEFFTRFYDNPHVSSLDIKPGNVCNFKCRICNPWSSSLYAEEARKYKKIEVDVDRLEYKEYVWDQIQQLLPDIENLDFLGGEPFLVKEIQRLLDFAVAQGRAPYITLHFNTNGSVWPSYIETLLKFKRLEVSFSIDNVGTRFELERGGSWSAVEENIINFKSLKGPVNLAIMPTINIQNVLYLEEIMRWADGLGIHTNLNFLDKPDWANINNLTETAIVEVYNRYKDSEYDVLRDLAEMVQRLPGSDGKEFIKQMKEYDRIRNQNFANTHSEIARAMGY